jgi:hypothetical protein
MGSHHGSQQWQRVMTLGFFFPPMPLGLSTETLELWLEAFEHYYCRPCIQALWAALLSILGMKRTR